MWDSITVNSELFLLEIQLKEQKMYGLKMYLLFLLILIGSSNFTLEQVTKVQRGSSDIALLFP